MKSMGELFHAQLQDVYFAEKQLVKALSKLANNSTNEQLVEAFTNHLEETERQVERLEKVFELIDKSREANSAMRFSVSSPKVRRSSRRSTRAPFATPVSWQPARRPSIARSPATTRWSYSRVPPTHPPP
jgi:hypothetical protein